MSPKPVIALVATGGTIAGRAASAADTVDYAAGVLDAEQLIAAVPGLDQLARLRTETLFNIDSKDMTPAHWLRLAHRLQALADDPAVDGLVVTHGTDTLEETAFFIHLTVRTDKPVVFTAAMRPATALSPDGPMNLYSAVRVAGSAAFRALGTLVVMSEQVFGARALTKQHTRSVAAFGAIDSAPLGWANPPTLTRRPAHVDHGNVALDRLQAGAWAPPVEILYLGAGSSPALLGACRRLGAAGAVLALPGNGSVPLAWYAEIEEAQRAGFPLVRASRVATGSVSPGGRPGGLLCADGLSPVKARIALMLALALDEPGLFAQIAAQPGTAV